jgi:hypothetical protein
LPSARQHIAADAVAARALGFVERQIRLLDELLDARRRVMADAGADADGDRNARAGRGDDVLGDELAQPLAGRDRAVEGCLRQNQREFLAAQAPDDVGSALLLLQDVGDRLDDLVAGVVAVSVVDPLEEVDVAHE